MNKISPGVGAELHTIMNLMKRTAKQYLKKETELTEMQSRIIGYLLCNAEKEIFQRDIEREFSVRRATASVLLTTMEQRGLIIRESVLYDARLKKICLTEKAVCLGENVKKDLLNLENMLIRDISETDMRVFFQVTEQIKKNLEHHFVSETETERNRQNQRG